MSENLNVNHFRNGDIISEVKTAIEWIKAGENEQPAWCYYHNDLSNGAKYGKLYNWYAVNDPRGLAPEGWRVPTDAEWTELTYYLTINGHIEIEGNALKSRSKWVRGKDAYGWNGLPGGNRSYNGNFDFVGSRGVWWSSSEETKLDAWGRGLGHKSDPVYRSQGNKNFGFSVRCIKD